MAFRLTYETDPRLLGQGAYASGLAEYDRRREQLALAYNQMAQQRAMASANRQSNAMNQMRAQDAARQRQMDAARLNQAAADQQQQDIMARMDHENQLRQQQNQWQAEQKIKLSEHAYELKKAERDRQVAYVMQAPWDEQTQREAISKINLGFSKYDVERPPSFQEQMEQMKADMGNFIAIQEPGGRIHIKEKPAPNTGEHQSRIINGREVWGQIQPDSTWKEYGIDEPKDTSRDDAKDLQARYDRAKKHVDAMYIAQENADPNEYHQQIIKAMNDEKSILDQFRPAEAQPGQGATITPEMQQAPPQVQQQAPPQEQAGGLPADQEWLTDNPQFYPGIKPSMTPQEIQSAGVSLAQDLSKLLQMYQGDLKAMQQNPAHTQKYIQLKRDLLRLRQIEGRQ